MVAWGGVGTDDGRATDVNRTYLGYPRKRRLCEAGRRWGRLRRPVRGGRALQTRYREHDQPVRLTPSDSALSLGVRCWLRLLDGSRARGARPPLVQREVIDFHCLDLAKPHLTPTFGVFHEFAHDDRSSRVQGAGYARATTSRGRTPTPPTWQQAQPHSIHFYT